MTDFKNDYFIFLDIDGVMNDENCAVEVFFDEDFTKMPRIGVHPNENTASVYLSSEDLLRVIREHGNRLEIVSFA